MFNKKKKTKLLIRVISRLSGDSFFYVLQCAQGKTAAFSDVAFYETLFDAEQAASALCDRFKCCVRVY